MASPKGFIVYRMFYGDAVVYVGRTRQQLQTRMHSHFHKSAYTMLLDINYISRIEYCELKSAADMAVAEVYFINKMHSDLNKDDHMKDELTFGIPEFDCIEWKEFIPSNWEKWKTELQDIHPTKRKNRAKNKRALRKAKLLK